MNKGEKEALNGHQNFIDIGYRLIPKYWKKGYGFNTMNYNVIYAAADVENIGSNKILQKIGLQFVNDFEYNFKQKKIKVNWYELKKENFGK